MPGTIITIIGLVLGLNFFGEYLARTRTSLAPTILAILLTCCGGFLALTRIILDSMSRMFYRMTNAYPNDVNNDFEDINMTHLIKTKNRVNKF